MSDEASPPPNDQRYPCPECHAGHVTLQHVVYYTWVNGDLITVPDFPAWVCDVCGMREYDQRALSWLNIILSPSTGRNSRPRQQPPQPPRPPKSRFQPDA